MIHLISGESTAQIEEEVQNILTIKSAIPFETIRDKVSMNDLMIKCATCDMFSAQKGFIIHEPTWLKKSTKNDQDDFKKLIDTITNHQIEMVLIVKSIDKRSAIYKQLKKAQAQEISCDGFKDWESDKMIKWLTNFASSKNIIVKQNTIEQLLNAYGNNLSLIKKEIEKLSVTILPKTTIETTDLVHSSSNSFGYYTLLSKAINQGNINDIIKSVYKLINLKEDPHKVFNQLLFQINNIIPILLGIKEHLNHENLAKKLGKHPFFIKKQMEMLQKNKLSARYIKLIPKLAVIDQDLKQGKLTGKQGLIKLSNQLKYQ